MISLEQQKKKEIISLIALKKERLAMPVYELKGDELVNPPWTHDNLDEWLYRPVKLTGRQIHRLAMQPHVQHGPMGGMHYIIPVVTQEDEERNHDSRKGL